MSKKTIREKIEQGREYREFTPIFPKGEKVIEGYATTFNDPYLLYKRGLYEVYEQVDRHAFDQCDLSDVIMQYDHEGRVFARNTNDTLEIRPDDHGLHTRADLGGTKLGNEIYDDVAGRYSTKMSMGFIVRKDKEEYEENKETGEVKILRTILEIQKLFDVSVVSYPANDHTAIATRHWCEGVIDNVRKEIAAEKRAKQRQKIKILLEATR